MSLFDTRFENLPDCIPLFPIPGVLLLPRGNLPLNVFEPRYLNMIEDALATGRIVGMIQPGDPDDKSKCPALYPVGCAGRIIHFEETDDGRFLISLKGICRFKVSSELPDQNGYRLIEPNWEVFEQDLTLPPDGLIDRKPLFKLLKMYFSQQGIEADIDSLKTAPDERLINSLAMVCPFNPAEKQALLLATDITKRCEILNTLLEMAALGDDIKTSRQ